MARILVADDDYAFRKVLSETLVDLGHTVREAASGTEALVEAQQQSVGVLFLDMRLPDLDGLEVLRRLRAQPRCASLPVVVLTAYTGSWNTIEAMKLGAFDYLTKPVGRRDLHEVLAHVLTQPPARKPVHASDDAVDEGLIGTSLPMRQVHKLIELGAAGNATVLITGATGTGKERVARALHYHSVRADMPFAAVSGLPLRSPIPPPKAPASSSPP